MALLPCLWIRDKSPFISEIKSLFCISANSRLSVCLGVIRQNISYPFYFLSGLQLCSFPSILLLIIHLGIIHIHCICIICDVLSQRLLCSINMKVYSILSFNTSFINIFWNKNKKIQRLTQLTFVLIHVQLILTSPNKTFAVKNKPSTESIVNFSEKG